MAEPTQTTPTEEVPRTYARCNWCKQLAAGARLVAIVEQGSGRGANLFACKPCRDLYSLVPLTDRP
ncbi:hypothetical protein [Streptomyces sp. YIM S03343]